MKISREETAKRLSFLKDYFSRDPEASCRSAQKALQSIFGQAMRPLVVSAAKQEVIDAQDAAIQAGFQFRAIPDIDLADSAPEKLMSVVNAGIELVYFDKNEVLHVNPKVKTCGGDCSKCSCGGR